MELKRIKELGGDYESVLSGVSKWHEDLEAPVLLKGM